MLRLLSPRARDPRASLAACSILLVSIAACEARPTSIDASRPDAKAERSTVASPRTEASTAPADPTVHPAPEGAAIVWATDADGHATSYWLERSPASEAFDALERPGIAIATESSLFVWREEPTPLALYLDCGRDRTDRRTGWGEGVRAGLRSLAGDRFLEVVAPAHERGKEAAELTQRVAVEGSYGRYLFVREVQWEYSCGAHGGSTHRFVVFDAERGEHAALHGEYELADIAHDLGALFPQEPDGLLEMPSEVRVTRFGPDFLPSGRVAFEYQLTGDTCYACGDDEWDSYTQSVQVNEQPLPARLAGQPEPREALAWFARRHPDRRIRGFSLPNAEDRARFERLPQTR
jgi:hypothetical protein